MLNKIIGLLSIISVLHLANAQSPKYYGNGYTIIEGDNVASYNDTELDTVIYKQIRSKKVKGALYEILKGSGWKLANRKNADPDIIRLYNQNYPQYKRTLNPVKLGEALEYVAGDAWDLVIDPVNHLVSFQLSEKYRCFTLKEASCSEQK